SQSPTPTKSPEPMGSPVTQSWATGTGSQAPAAPAEPPLLVPPLPVIPPSLVPPVPVPAVPPVLVPPEPPVPVIPPLVVPPDPPRSGPPPPAASFPASPPALTPPDAPGPVPPEPPPVGFAAPASPWPPVSSLPESAPLPPVLPLLPPDARCVPASSNGSGDSLEQAANAIQSANKAAPFRPALRFGELGEHTMPTIMRENAPRR